MSDPVLDQNDGSFNYAITLEEGLVLSPEFLKEVFGCIKEIKRQRTFRVFLESNIKPERTTRYNVWYPESTGAYIQAGSQNIFARHFINLSKDQRLAVHGRLTKKVAEIIFSYPTLEETLNQRYPISSYMSRSSNRYALLHYIYTLLELWKIGVFEDSYVYTIQNESIPTTNETIVSVPSDNQIIATLYLSLDTFDKDGHDFQIILAAIKVFQNRQN